MLIKNHENMYMKCNMEKIIIFTGSFNPVTKAHLKSLQTAMSVINADKGIFVPVCDSYLKKKMLNNMSGFALSSQIRVQMLEALCSSDIRLEVSDYEVKSNDSIHTYKTLLYFKNKYSDAEIYFLNGADKLKNIPNWNNAEELLKNIRFILFDRDKLNADEIISKDPLLCKYHSQFTILPVTEGFADISSSKVRKMFLAGDENYKSMLDEKVESIFSKINLADYPEPSIYDWIKGKLNGSPFDKLYGYKKVYELNRELFKTTDMSLMLDNSKKLNSMLFGKNCKNTNVDTRIIYTDEDVNSLISNVREKNLAPVIISEACFWRVGGGYDQGKANTFEEELCRVSTLSQSLYKYGSPKLKCVRESEVNREDAYPLEIGDGFYSPQVEIVRYGKDGNYSEIDKRKRQTCDIISMASIDFSKTNKLNNIKEYMNSDGSMNDAGKNILKKIICKAFDYAIATNHDAVILNAFGSGYHIDPCDIAVVMKNVFDLYRGKVKLIVVKGEKSKRFMREFYKQLFEV